MKETLGQLLSSARQQKGLTTIEVSETTRFSLRFVKAAEEDRFDELPSSVFAIGFLRNYSALLDLDGDSMVEKYASLGIKQKDSSPELISMPLHKDPGESIKVIFISIGLLIVAVSAIVYSYFGNLEMLTAPEAVVAKPPPPPTVQKTETFAATESLPDEQQDMESADTITTIMEEEVESVDQSSESSQDENMGLDSESHDVADQAMPDDEMQLEKPPLRLKIAADSDTWIKVTIDGGEPIEIILKKGKSVEWEADSGYVLSLGNVAGAHVFIDEKEIAMTKPANNVIIDMKLPAISE